jgi:hypothetical protein
VSERIGMSVSDRGLRSLFVGMRSFRDGVVVLDFASCVAGACAWLTRFVL